MIPNHILSHIERSFGTITNTHSVGGGCIADTYKISCHSQTLFLKCGQLIPGMFHKEAHGLQELQKTNSIYIPKVIDVQNDFLLLEHIEPGIRKPDFFSIFGKAFAQMHRYTSKTCGFFENNYLGLSFQKNTPSTDWADFFFSHRLVFQLELMKEKKLECKDLEQLIFAAESTIRQTFSHKNTPFSLLHGDLWGGNYMVNGNGMPCLIDPAVYYGDREADLAMTKLFGGFSPEFYRAYEEEYPLPAGHKEREILYTLYHIMNHYTLFGGGYYNQAISLIKQFI
ncbi:MAG: fructosamine kinase family protein [Bacteroidales bacterium]|jgi:protein-ribulosamine 3-kinase|nr:fructosamine kinase family protein [Bacteroidales bacterium]